MRQGGIVDQHREIVSGLLAGARPGGADLGAAFIRAEVNTVIGRVFHPCGVDHDDGDLAVER